MQLSSDIEMRNPLWERADSELCSNNQLGIFNRLVDVFVIACAIGIKDDCLISDSELSNPLTQPKTIGRNTHRENLDVRDLLDFMLQNALIHSKTIDIDEDERLKLAFNPDYNSKKIRPADFLVGFANYGIEKIYENISSASSLVVESELYKYFESMANDKYDDILKTITLEEITRN